MAVATQPFKTVHHVSVMDCCTVAHRRLQGWRPLCYGRENITVSHLQERQWRLGRVVQMHWGRRAPSLLPVRSSLATARTISRATPFPLVPWRRLTFDPAGRADQAERCTPGSLANPKRRAHQEAAFAHTTRATLRTMQLRPGSAHQLRPS